MSFLLDQQRGIQQPNDSSTPHNKANRTTVRSRSCVTTNSIFWDNYCMSSWVHKDSLSRTTRHPCHRVRTGWIFIMIHGIKQIVINPNTNPNPNPNPTVVVDVDIDSTSSKNCLENSNELSANTTLSLLPHPSAYDWKTCNIPSKAWFSTQRPPAHATAVTKRAVSEASILAIPTCIDNGGRSFSHASEKTFEHIHLKGIF